MDKLEALERAVSVIEDDLGSVGAQEAAQKTGYSYYHLTRLFSNMLGEPMGSYIKKRRLADGAHKLLYTDKRVIDIAVENGFGSSEAFSRAFKAVYCVSPAQYRRNRRDVIVGAKKRLQPGLLRHIAGNVTVRPQIVKFEGAAVAGLRGQTTIGKNVVPLLWKRFLEMEGMITGRAKNARRFGICETDETVYTMNRDAVFSEFVGIEVESAKGLPEQFEQKILHAGKYAVFTHTGSLARLRETFDFIWGTWFPASGTQLDYGEDFELYDERFRGPDNPESQIDIYVPIK